MHCQSQALWCKMPCCLVSCICGGGFFFHSSTFPGVLELYVLDGTQEVHCLGKQRIIDLFCKHLKLTKYRTHRVQTHDVNSAFSWVQTLWEHTVVGLLFWQEPYRFVTYIWAWSHLFTTEYILLGNFSGVKCPYCTKLLQNCSCSQIPINFQWLARFSLSIWYERTFFLLFMGVGSSFDLKIKLSSFSSSLSGITVCSKA